jgi:hypothetical protein
MPYRVGKIFTSDVPKEILALANIIVFPSYSSLFILSLALKTDVSPLNLQE